MVLCSSLVSVNDTSVYLKAQLPTEYIEGISIMTPLDFVVDVLRRHHRQAGLPEYFSIAFHMDKVRLLMDILTVSSQYDPEVFNPHRLIRLFSHHKREGIPLGQWEDEQLKELYGHYSEALRKNASIDENEAFELFHFLLESCSEVRQELNESWDWICLDSAELLPRVFHNSMSTMLDSDLNMVATFDPNGSSLSMTDLYDLYPDMELKPLGISSPSTCPLDHVRAHLNVMTMLQYANSSPPSLSDSDYKESPPLRLVLGKDEKDEARCVAASIQNRRLDSGVAFKNMAIYYRSSQQLPEIMDQLDRLQIPYRVLGVSRLFKSSIIQQLLAYMRLAINPRDCLAFKEVVSLHPLSLSSAVQIQLFTFSESKKKSVFELLNSSDLPVGKRIIKRLTLFFDLVQKWHSNCDSKSSPEGLLSVILTDLNVIERLKSDDELLAYSQLGLVDDFIEELGHFKGNCEQFFSCVHNNDPTLFCDSSQDVVRIIHLQYVHSLTFNSVFIPGMENGLVPHYNTQMDISAREKDLRDFYYALCSASHFVSMFSAITRNIFNQEVHDDLSDYIRNMSSQCVTVFASQKVATDKPTDLDHLIDDGYSYHGVLKGSSMSLAHMVNEFFQGERVRHVEYGDGVIESVNGQGDSAILTISFPSGRRQLMAKYSKLERI